MENMENQQYQQGGLQKEEILDRLRRKGCRITKQRETLMDIILEEKCTCCKEIYYLASKKLPDIGIATIYRMINVLEEIGAIRRANAYRVCHEKGMGAGKCIMVELEDNTIVELNVASLQQVVEKGMEVCGYLEGRTVKNVAILREAQACTE